MKRSVVTAVMDRIEPLCYTIPSWANDPHVTEIIILDYGSAEHVTDSLAAIDFDKSVRSKIRVIRIDGVTRWHLTKAYNFGFEFAQNEIIVKADADILNLEPNWAQMIPPEGYFVAGSWLHMRCDNESHLSGTFCVRKADFWRVNGFDERIDTYGYDDDDLYIRLSKFITQIPIPPKSVFHLPHSMKKRTENQDNIDPAGSIQHNRYRVENRELWGTDFQRQAYRRVGEDTYVETETVTAMFM